MGFLYILLALFVFGLLIFIHELGHFIAARLCGVTVLEFAIGMGPKLFSVRSKKSGTAYSLRLIPVGGFVSMLGETGMEAVQGSAELRTDDIAPQADASQAELVTPADPKVETTTEIPEKDPHAYCNQSVWKRILISVAGPAMNVVLGFILMLAVVLLAGHASLGTTTIAGFYVSYSGSEEYQGLKPNDVLYSVDTDEPKDRILSFEQFQKRVAEDEDGIIDIYVQRINEELKANEIICVTNVALDPQIAQDPNYFQMAVSEAAGLRVYDEVIKINSTRVHTNNELVYEIMHQGDRPMKLTVLRDGNPMEIDLTVRQTEEQGTVIGEMDFIIFREANFDAPTVIKHTWFRSCSTVKTVFDSLKGLITGRYGLASVSGPVGITKTISNAAKLGFVNLLYLITLISINLGVMNLLPIPGLDGGHLLIYFVEVIRRKPMKQEIEGLITFIGLALMLGLMVIIAIKDIITL